MEPKKQELSKREKLENEIVRLKSLLKKTQKKLVMADFEEVKELMKEKNMSWAELKEVIERK